MTSSKSRKHTRLDIFISIIIASFIVLPVITIFDLPDADHELVSALDIDDPHTDHESATKLDAVNGDVYSQIVLIHSYLNKDSNELDKIMASNWFQRTINQQCAFDCPESNALLSQMRKGETGTIVQSIFSFLVDENHSETSGISKEELSEANRVVAIVREELRL